MDGFRREGIFRISAHVDDIKRAKQQIREGKDVEFNDPFCAADVLKRFIRELPDSLFEGYYLACVQLAKSEAGLSDYRTFWESMKLPSEHRALLEWLFDLILEVSELPYSSTSKMCLRNYAIVFAPNLLRPDSEDDSDWMLHLQNAPYEVSFIYNLLQALSKSEEPLSTTDDLEEDSKVNSEVIFKSRNRAVAESDQKTSLMGHRRLSSNLLSSGQEDSFHLPSDDSDKE